VGCEEAVDSVGVGGGGAVVVLREVLSGDGGVLGVGGDDVEALEVVAGVAELE